MGVVGDCHGRNRGWQLVLWEPHENGKVRDRSLVGPPGRHIGNHLPMTVVGGERTIGTGESHDYRRPCARPSRDQGTPLQASCLAPPKNQLEHNSRAN